jgi:hypothetical protein
VNSDVKHRADKSPKSTFSFKAAFSAAIDGRKNAYGSPNPTFKQSSNFCSSAGERLPNPWATVSV